ncbi:BTAD domain-containing putative transcriptional regulator [Nonomuraea sp. NPDC046802]|uniref:AfsR/SARP family transcriptional regulator n=1 Tax=Nonomuraea sp. NPDC046802 TaxID=3154919 RepID=UPI0033E07A65
MLGELQLIVHDAPVPVGPPKRQALLALLLLRRNRLVPMGRIVGGIWGATPPATARAQVHAHVAGLRGLLESVGAGRDMLRTGPAGYVLQPPPGSVDLDLFDELAGSARTLLDDGNAGEAITAVREALSLWRGTGLDGLRAAFAADAAEQLKQRRLAAIELLADAHHAARRDGELIPELDELCSAHPLHEGLRYRLMLALHRNGRTADALRVYREGWRITTTELGIEPGARLRELETAILQGGATLLDEPHPDTTPMNAPHPGLAFPGPALSHDGNQPHAPPPHRGTRPRDDMGSPSDPAQNTQPRSQPTRALVPVPSFQLPPDVPAFIGRAGERAHVLSCLSATSGPGEQSPVIVVTGPPGIGKTSFVVHVGQDVRDQYPDGQLFLPMRGPSGAPVPLGQAVATLLRGLGLAGAAIPEGEAERLATYRSVLAGRRVLIVLDDAVNAADVRRLLVASPGCALLVTSRSALTGVDAERVRLAPLALDEALALLSATAGAERVAADPASAARIVRRCGYLPLAVRIAGARLAGNSQRKPAELSASLRDQRRRLDELAVDDLAVRTALASADQELSAPAREAYHLLSVLLPAQDVAGWVVAALLDATPSDAERIVDELVGMNLLLPAGRGRYRLLDLVRLYGREQALARVPSERRRAAGERLCGAYLDLATRAEQEFGGGFVEAAPRVVPVWSLPEALARKLVADPMAWFEAERVPLGAVVVRAAATGATGAAAGLAAALAVFYEARTYFDDWRTTHERVLRAARRSGDDASAMAMLRNLGELHTIQDRYPAAADCFEEALDHAKRIGDIRYEAATLSGLGYVRRLTGCNEQAAECFSRAERLCRQMGNVPGEVYAIHGLGIMLLDRRQWAEARARFEACLRLSRRAGYLAGEARALRCLGAVDNGDGHHASAEQRFRNSGEVGARLGDRLVEAHAMRCVGDLRIRNGDTAEGIRLLYDSLAVYRACGQRFGEAMVLRGLAHAAMAKEETGSARHYLIQATRIWERIGSPFWLERARAELDALDDPSPCVAPSA